MKTNEIWISHSVRTAIGTYGGSLKDIPATELGAAVIKAVMAKSGLKSEVIESVVMGNVIQAGNKMNPARQAAINGGLQVSTPAMTVNRVCRSGVQAIVSAGLEISAGAVNCAIAGGMENMDRAPYIFNQGRWGVRMGDATMHDSMLYDGLHDAFSGNHAGWHTEDIVEKFGMSRADQDRWAFRSQERFANAQLAGLFENEIVSVSINNRKGTQIFAKDEHNRPETTAESLAKLKPAFRKDGTLTAGNAPGLNSGAAAMLLTERSYAERIGIYPQARIAAFGMSAVEPDYFGIAPVTAGTPGLDQGGLENPGSGQNRN